MTRVALRDELLDAQLLRLLGTAAAGGADFGESLATASLINEKDLDSWHREWHSLGASAHAMGEAALAAGQTVSARAAFFRASNYFRTAGVMLMGSPIDERLVASNCDQNASFRAGAALLACPPEVLQIPFEGTTLPGYLFRPHQEPSTAPTLVLTGGYDGTAEELYFLTGAAALDRGYNVVAFDGPGQGAALLQQGLTLRPDWERVIGAVLDHTIGVDGIDAHRVALVGLSLGGHLAPRAAAGEPRLAACIADCGSFDLFEAALSRMPGPLAEGLRAHKALPTAVVRRVLDRLAAKPTAGWALRRGQLVHGARSPLDYLEMLREYSLEGHAHQISCPTLVCHAERDDIGASAPQLAAALQCPHDLILFRDAEGAGDHCEAGARSLFHARAFAWLDRVLAHTEAAAC